MEDILPLQRGEGWRNHLLQRRFPVEDPRAASNDRASGLMKCLWTPTGRTIDLCELGK